MPKDPTINTIILAAGRMDYKNTPFHGVSSYGMMPVRGKPFILWCLEAAEKNVAENEITVVVRSNNSKLISYLNNLISWGKPIRLAVYDRSVFDTDNILTSILVGLQKCDLDVPTQIILGDTMIRGSFPEIKNVVLASNEIRASGAWCLIENSSKNQIIKFFNKQKGLDIGDKAALIGYYKLDDSKLLRHSVDQALNNCMTEISDALNIYQKRQNIAVQMTSDWLDFGHISSIVKASHELFSVREFNNLKVDSIRGTITKTSRNKQKLSDELYWYQHLPDELKIFVPRILKAKETKTTFSLEMELFGYPSLSEIFVHGENSFEDMTYMLDKLFKIQKTFLKYTTEANQSELAAIYRQKTIARVAELFETETLRPILEQDYLLINGKTFRNYNLLIDDLKSEIERLIAYNGKFSITHGDYCFSNILFDTMNYTFKLIDPRGRFLSRTIYGDARYDIAKLRHSAVGLYDFIILGFYNLLQKNNSEFEFTILADENVLALESYFDKLVLRYGFSTHQIKVIESLLFLTMIPLHKENSKRQKILYLIAIVKLNKILYEK